NLWSFPISPTCAQKKTKLTTQGYMTENKTQKKVSWRLFYKHFAHKAAKNHKAGGISAISI
ncbi:MAG: hypothetical protein JJT94_06575, partial [Bernardetiaceae bacterium]|nr:hypothetical protein [Bernardetiaceae bacterium]